MTEQLSPTQATLSEEQTNTPAGEATRVTSRQEPATPLEPGGSEEPDSGGSVDSIDALQERLHALR
jgi:hypothetical protein